MMTATDNHHCELCITLYLLYRARAKQLRYSVGRHILKSKHFDDIYWEVKSQEQCLLYLFDVKHHRYKNRRTSFNELVDRSGFGCDFDLKRYFKAYLQFKERMDQPIQELVVWTKADFKTKDGASEHDGLEYIVEKGANDLFESDEFDIRKYRIQSGAAIEKELVDMSHPLYELASTIARLMFRKTAISSKSVSKRFYIVLRKDVFKDGDHFKEEFLRCSEDLCCEAKRFHDLLELVLSEQFLQKGMGNFQHLIQIEQLPFEDLVQVKVVDEKLDQRDIDDATWDVDYDVSETDVQQFLSALVFYTNAPTKNQFKTVIKKYCDMKTKDVLEKICAKGVLLQSGYLNDIFELMSMQNAEETRTFNTLEFRRETLKSLEEVVLRWDSEKSTNKLIIEAGGDLNDSVERVRNVLDRNSKNLFTFNGKTFLEKLNKLTNLSQVFKTTKLDWWIVLVIDKDFTICNELCDLNCNIIVVVPKGNNFHNPDFSIYEDRFTFDDLSDNTKYRISSTAVLLQGRHFDLDTLLGEDALATIPMMALSDWSQYCYQQIVIGERIMASECDAFLPRRLQTDCDFDIDPFETNYQNVAVLSALPGMGKSTLLRQLAENFSEQFDDHIVLLVDAKRIVDWIDCVFDTTELIRKLMHISANDNIHNFIIQKMVEDHRVIFLLDGFDEISLSKEKNAITMLDWLCHAHLHLVMIATRPNRLESLQKNLVDSTVYYISPLTEDDQFQYLKQRLSSKSESENESSISDIMAHFSTLFNNENPLENPLHCAIITRIYEEELANRPFLQWNVADVLQMFVDKKFEIYADKFFDRHNRAHESILETLKTSFDADHSELAFRLDTNQPIVPEHFANLEPYGLLRTENGTVQFIHATIAEFFVAQYLVRHHVDQIRFNRYLLEHFCTPSQPRFDAFLEHHISKTDSRQKLFGSNPSSQNMNLKELRVLPKYKLHPDKIKQLHIFFVECCSLEQQLEYVRRSIARAVFSTFQIIYESLPKSLVQETRFKFASNANNPFSVDLSQLSEDNLRKLLKIIHQEHSQDVVQKIITSFNHDEDDFISTAIKRDHRQIIEELFCLEQSLTDEDESDLLQEYLAGRWKQYLKLTIDYRREALLKQSLDIIDNRFHQRMIKYFLMNCNILRVVLETFTNEQGDVAIAQLVLDFVDQHLSDYDLNVLMNRKEDAWVFAEKLQDLRNPEIRELCKTLWNRCGVLQR